MRSVMLAAIALILLAGSVACGGDDDTNGTPGSAPAQDTAVEDAEADDAGTSTSDSTSDRQPSGAAASGGAGTLMLGDEMIELASARCFLEEQDVFGSEGKILLTAQGVGTTAEGEEFILDITRYDEDSLFTGDEIVVDVGDPRGGDFYSWGGSADLGTIERDGSTLRADGLTFQHSEDGSEVPGSFVVNC